MNASRWRIEMRGDERCIVDDAGVVAVVFGDLPDEARAILHAAQSLDVAVSALKKAEKAIAGTLHARGYQAGSCTDDWSSEVGVEVRTLAEVRAALAVVAP